MPVTTDQQLTHLALSLYNQPGVYAALLGSGISFSSGIPTAWGVVTTLIARLAAADSHEVTSSAELEEWYSQRYGEAPDYSRVIERLEGTRAGQQALLRPFFEPTAEDVEEGRKQPSPAHRALADLCVKGYVRVILTTNFDRLMERALEERGITPNVASDPAELQVIRPMRHSGVTIIKLHGDYMKANVRNAGQDLQNYDAAWDSLLDTVLDEYGLIVCGWSGDCDPALRAAIERGQPARYGTYWSAYATPSAAAQALIDHRGAQVISGLGADQFFTGVEERVSALERVNLTPPLTLDLLEARIKRHLGQPDRYRIDLQDLLEAEAKSFSEALQTAAFPDAEPTTLQDRRAALEGVEALGERWARVTRTLMKYDDGERFAPVWNRALQYLNPTGIDRTGTTFSQSLRWASVMAFCHTAFSLVAAHDRFQYATVLVAWGRREREQLFAVLKMFNPAAQGMYQDLYHKVYPGYFNPDGSALRHATSQYLKDSMLPEDLELAMDRGEVLLSLVHASLESKVAGPRPATGTFRYGQRGRDPHKAHIGAYLRSHRPEVVQLLGGAAQAVVVAEIFDQKMTEWASQGSGFGGKGFITGAAAALNESP